MLGVRRDGTAGHAGPARVSARRSVSQRLALGLWGCFPRVPHWPSGFELGRMESSSEPGPAARGAERQQELEEVGKDWVKITNGDQAPYYWHRPTGRTQWVRPLEACAETAGSEQPDTDQQYFAAYGNWWKIQREMLADRPRMQGYVDAIEAHADAIRGKVVIDVGAGTVTPHIICASMCPEQSSLLNSCAFAGRALSVLRAQGGGSARDRD